MTAPTEKGRRGCLLNGLLLASVISLLILAGGLIGLRYFKRMLENFTSATAAPVPVEVLGGAEAAALKGRVERFKADLQSGRRSAPLELTVREINGLIAADSGLAPLRGRLHLTTMDQGRIKGQISAPLDQLNLKVFAGRYLNGEAQFQLSFANGHLRLSPDLIVVQGRPVPQTYMDAIRRQNLAAPLAADPQATNVLERIESIEIREGRLVITPKAGE